MVLYWTKLAKNGDPNGARVPEWPRLRADAPAVQSLVPRITSRFDFSAKHKCDVWNPILVRTVQPAAALIRKIPVRLTHGFDDK